MEFGARKKHLIHFSCSHMCFHLSVCMCKYVISPKDLNLNFFSPQDQMCSRLKIRKAERDKILTYKADAKKESRDLLNQTEAERQETRAVFRQLRQFLKEQEKSLLAQVEVVEKEIARRRDAHVARLSRELSSCGEKPHSERHARSLRLPRHKFLFL
ncbi:hypothetical protein lerEdw1_010940 [Lerista edwardsae]|nr:hypothetical protein lerEdw1_010940 [Lerista edwardsae]